MRETNDFEVSGYAIIPAVLSADECAALIAHAEQLDTRRAGSRNLLEFPWCRNTADALRRHPSIAALLTLDAVCTQCTMFRKDVRRNWSVAYHQDLSIAVAAKIEHPDCGGWSEKQGVLHVQPPAEFLAELVAVRLQLDEGVADAGPLRVIPQSHGFGRISDEQIAVLRAPRNDVECVVPLGGVLALSPLLLHASPKMRAQTPRRVLHFVFGPRELPCGLTWHTAV